MAKIDDDLWITTGTRRRCLPLPRRIVHLDLCKASVQDQTLVVHFTAAVGVS